MKPVVAIVGRPNVGKSTLFNAISGETKAIVENTPGVTRDRIYADASWLDKDYLVVDTGGIEPDTSDILLQSMRSQAQLAIDTADVIIFVTDAKSGMTDADVEVANMLRKSHKPVVVAVNKLDNMLDITAMYEFYSLGLGDPMPISAEQGQGIGDLLDEVVKYFPEKAEGEEESELLKLAVIGKPNVGKSSLINKLLGEDRVIVSDIAGTTRDSIDAVVTNRGRQYLFIDTAGIRRQSRVNEDIERVSVIRAVASVERCDIAIVMIDAETGVTEQDAKIAGLAHEKGKGLVLAVNKWDAIEKDDKTIYKFSRQLDETLSFIPYAEKVFISAKTGLRIDKLFDSIQQTEESQNKRVPTGVLNDVLYEAMSLNQPPSDKGRRLKIYYMTQIGVKPPTFVIFVNDKKLMHYSYTRYIENQIRENFGFSGTPLQFIIRERGVLEERF